MKIDLSRSIDQSFKKALKRADLLRETGQPAEAAAVYREAAGLMRKLAQYAVGSTEKSRRLNRVKELEEYAEKVARQKATLAHPRDAEAPDDTDELQTLVDALVTRADVNWDDIGGLKQTKREIQMAFGMAVARKPLGVTIEAVGNALLYGPPGTGKSLLAAAVSNGLNATFFNVNASKLLSKWFGESPRLISTLFATARTRAPAMIFIDELEALFPSRESSTSGAERRVLSTLLAELSGVSTSGTSPTVFTIGATNAPWLMDSAALSRFGRRVYVPLPDADARRAVLEIHLLRRGHTIDFPIERLVEATAGLSGRQLSHLTAAAVERMVADSNPDLADIAASRDAALADYQIKTRSLQWSDIEPVLAKTQPDTSAETLRQFQTW